MADLAAIRNAIYLFHMPSAVRQARGASLPAGITLLLEIAAEETGVAEAAASELTRPSEVVRQSAAFYIEQVLLAPESDSYRVLGASRETPSADLRRNMALLLRWTHPDADRAGTRAAFASRITKAWENLKTQERRDSYDASHPLPVKRPPAGPTRQTGAHVVPAGAASRPTPVNAAAPGALGILRRAIGLLLGGKR